MKAIETVYKGYRFRSRLEARWAVFFDALGLRWEYEPEGFETAAGWYLPDFRVWDPGDAFVCYVEVRPTNDFDPKVRAFNEQLKGTKAHCQFVYGDPLEWFARREQRLEGGSWLAGAWRYDEVRQDHAALRARQARFEHGETPA